MTITTPHKHTHCPRCGSGWIRVSDPDLVADYKCAAKCGMEAQVSQTLTNYEGYYINIGIDEYKGDKKYQVYWYPEGKCEIWSRGGTLTLDEPLPFDVTEDMIEVALVFQ